MLASGTLVRPGAFRLVCRCTCHTYYILTSRIAAPQHSRSEHSVRSRVLPSHAHGQPAPTIRPFPADRPLGAMGMAYASAGPRSCPAWPTVQLQYAQSHTGVRVDNV